MAADTVKRCQQARGEGSDAGIPTSEGDGTRLEGEVRKGHEVRYDQDAEHTQV